MKHQIYSRNSMKLHSLFTAMALASCACVSFAADFEKDVNDLIPGLAAADASGRYEPMMQMQALAANASKPGSEADRLALSRVLAAKAVDASVPQPARVWIVRQLEYIGKGESVEALTKVLNDPDAELRECARRALQKNPDSAAGKPLIAALEAIGPEQTPDAVRWKNGLISALGDRRDRTAVAAITKRLAEPELVAVSALALGSIADIKAVQALTSASGIDPSIIDGLIRAADRQIKAGNKASAADICERIFAKSNAVQQQAATLAILAKADPAAAQKRISAALTGNDWRLQKAAVDAAPDAFGASYSASLAAMLPTLPERSKTFVLRVLEASSESAVLAAAKDDAVPVRVAALESLGRIGSAAAVPVLLNAALDGDAAIKSAAVTSLGTANSPGATAAIEQAAGQGEAKTRAVAIAALATRNDTAALPALVKYAADSDATVSKAACAALAKFGSEKELPGLAELVLAGNTKGADEALQAVASRATDKSAAAQMLVQRAGSASGPQLAAMLDILSMLGGDEALGAVVKFTGSDNAATRESAIRALANWQEFPAAKPLLDIAANSQTSDVLCILSLQGVNRLAKAAEKESGADRVAAVQAAMKTARRDQERKLAVSSLGAIADRNAADALLPLLKDAQWGKDAATASLNLADALRRNDRNTSRKLAEAVKAANLSEELNKRADAILTRRF
jgi:HEAT repeat protein